MWILIVVASLGTTDRGVAVYSVPNFTNETTCRIAPAKVEEAARRVFGKNAQGLSSADCVQQ